MVVSFATVKPGGWEWTGGEGRAVYLAFTQSLLQHGESISLTKRKV